jgi:ferritin-like protein
MTEYHESREALPEKVRDQHRALKSLVEEVEAIDWYNQRIAVTSDGDLRDALAHNRDEEIEHAAMMLEWLRRNMDGWEDELRTYLFSDGPLAHHEEDEADPDDAASAADDGTLGLGNLTR